MCSSSPLTAATIDSYPQRVTAFLPKGAPLGPGRATIANRLCAVARLRAIGEKNRRCRGACGRTYTSPPQGGSRAGRPGCALPKDAAHDRDDEAHLPAEEAKAGPCARVSRAHALARRADDAQTPARQGAQAPVGVAVAGTV